MTYEKSGPKRSASHFALNRIGTAAIGNFRMVVVIAHRRVRTDDAVVGVFERRQALNLTHPNGHAQMNPTARLFALGTVVQGKHEQRLHVLVSRCAFWQSKSKTCLKPGEREIGPGLVTNGPEGGGGVVISGGHVTTVQLGQSRTESVGEVTIRAGTQSC